MAVLISTSPNDPGLVQGQLDIPLNDHGRMQIGRLAKHCQLVPFNRIYTSNLSRAVESAEIIAQHPAHGDMVIDERLGDRHYGSLQGETWGGGHLVPRNAETQHALRSRLREWLKNLVQTHTPSTSPLNSPTTLNGSMADVVLAVTHEECLLTLLDLLTSNTKGEGGVDVDVDVAHGVDIQKSVDNGRFCIVRV